MVYLDSINCAFHKVSNEFQLFQALIMSEPSKGWTEYVSNTKFLHSEDHLLHDSDTSRKSDHRLTRDNVLSNLSHLTIFRCLSLSPS